MLSIAGSDSGGGAGIQADLKAFARCGVHGMTAITAITAQNTTGVLAVHAVPPEIVLAQVRAVLADIGVDAVKVGMLGSVEATLAVARALRELPRGTPVVVDPVMVAESGARLLDPGAQRALVEEILPLAAVVTPNVPEARLLAGGVRGVKAIDAERGGTEADFEDRASPYADAASPAGAGAASPAGAGAASPARAGDGDGDPPGAGAEELTDAEAEALARAVLALGPRAVVLTGGHRMDGRSAADGTLTVDLFVSAEDGGGTIEIPGERHRDGAAHGSGCTHSSVLAAQLALGLAPLAAARVARRLAGEAVARGLRDIGAGAGPVDVLGLGALRGGIIEER